MMPDLSIIVVNWNTRDLLERCLRSVLETVAGLTFEVLVVDNASADDSVAMAKDRFPDVRIIENSQNVGFARANNQAIRQCASRYVLLLNSDTIVQEGAMEAMIAFLDTHPAAGMAGSKLLDECGSVQKHDPCFPTLFSELCIMTHLDRLFLRCRGLQCDPDRQRAVGWLVGACLMVRREAIEEVGLLDEGFFMYGEEMDWCWRFHKAGWEIWYVPQAVVVHLGGASTRPVAEEMFLQLYRSRVAFFRKHYGQLGARLLKVELILGSLLRLAMGPAAYVLSPGQRANVLHKFRCYAQLLGVLSSF